MAPSRPTGLAVKETYFIVTRTLRYLYDVATRRESGDQLGGLFRIADISGQVATLGFLALIKLTAVLSVSIGLINLFPIPLLDGGHLMFYAIEAVRGAPAERAAQEVGFRIGLAIVLLLLVYTTYQDRFIPLGGSGSADPEATAEREPLRAGISAPRREASTALAMLSQLPQNRAKRAESDNIVAAPFLRKHGVILPLPTWLSKG